MKPIILCLSALGLLVLAGCPGEIGPEGAAGADGAACTAVDNNDGTKTVTCGDDTFVISDGDDGTDGDNGTNGTNGDNGTDGDDCGVVDNADGTFTITCGADTPVVVTDPGFVPADYTAADGIKGGTAYIKWYTTQADGLGDLVTDYGVNVGADFVRCKACHAWDGFGNAASYATRTGQSSGNAGRPDVSSVNLRQTVGTSTEQQLFDLIQNPGGRDLDSTSNAHPDFATALSDAQTWNLVKFMKEEWINPDDLYDWSVDGAPMHWEYDQTVDNGDATFGNLVLVSPTVTYSNIGAGGNAANGDTIYTTTCLGCHGADGTTIDMGGRSVGEFTRDKPNEMWLKAKFGEPGKMDAGLVTSTSDMLDLYLALTNTTTYPDIP